jgi:N-acyl homoserine lactone hydrolase
VAPQTTVSHRPTRRTFLTFAAGATLGALSGGILSSQAAQTQSNAPPAPLPNVVQVPAQTITTASGIRVHIIQTGFVAVKRAHRQLVGLEGARLLSIAADTRWTDWMPINTWVIEHPEGTIVIDTGETSSINDDGYVDCDPVTGLVYRLNLRFSVTPQDMIDAQMRGLELDPADVRTVVQTHLHSDHMGGIGAFPNAQIFVPRDDYPAGMGVLSCHFPANFAPHFADFRAAPVPGFDRAHALTRDGAVLVIPTPGHSLGHQSVLLRDGVKTYLFAGDTTFDDVQLREVSVGGIVADVGQARATIRSLQRLAGEEPTVYLPTHDPDARRRLLAGEITTL